MTSAILTGLRVKKETIGEISAAAQVMREFANRVEVPALPHFVDIVGTGGDGAHNAERLLQVFRGEDQGAHRHALLLGAALVLEVTAQAATPRDALAMAAAAIDSGAALRMAEALCAFGASASATA